MTEAELRALIAAFRSEAEDLYYALEYRYYFNQGVPYTSTGEVLSVIPVEERIKYLTVNVAGVEYWFSPDVNTLVPKIEDLTISDKSVTLAKIQDITGPSVIGKTSGTGTPEVISISALATLLGLIDGETYNNDLSVYVEKVFGYSLVSNDLILKIHDKFATDEAAVIQAIEDFLNNLVLTDNNYTDDDKVKLDSINRNTYSILLPSGDIPTKVAGATFNTEGWATILQSGDYDVVVTHSLTSRKCAFVNVWEIDGSNERLLSFDKGTAYTGILASGMTVLIEGLAPTTLPLRIEFIFN